MKILIDMNLSPKFEDLLIRKGIDAVHWSKIGAPNAEDTEIMEYASKNNYIVMTCDLDFSIILSIKHTLKPSIIQLRNAKNRCRTRRGMDCIGNNAKCGRIRKRNNFKCGREKIQTAFFTALKLMIEIKLKE